MTIQIKASSRLKVVASRSKDHDHQYLAALLGVPENQLKIKHADSLNTNFDFPQQWVKGIVKILTQKLGKPKTATAGYPSKAYTWQDPDNKYDKVCLFPDQESTTPKYFLSVGV